MGLFNFLKSREPALKVPTLEKNTVGECNIENTQIVDQLFGAPKDQRDDKWHSAFYEAVKTASFTSTASQIFSGPDGFQYFVLTTPIANQPFEPFCITNILFHLLENGLGVAINPAQDSVDWVFSYGDVVNFQLNKEFITSIGDMTIEPEVIIKKDEKILIGQPSEEYLPAIVRNVLRKYLISIGVKKPKVALIVRTFEEQPLKELAFNIYKDDFKTEDEFQFHFRRISWFLPKHYIIISLPKKDWEEKFGEL